MAYQMKNISSENRATLAKITSDLEKGILGAIEETKYLQNALGIFKQSINNYADNALEKADIVAKYKDVTKVLSDIDDPRAEQLIVRTTEDCKNAICSIFE